MKEIRCLLIALAISTSPTEAQSPSQVARDAYRHFHEHPELGKQEHLTSSHIRAEIARIGGATVEPIAALPTAVIAVLETGTPGPTIALRADMDGRPLDRGQVEPLSHNPRSRVNGRMHNCGHDAHSAMLLGAFAHISANRSQYRGRIVFVFQPAEETRGGADDIVADGVLERLGVEAIFAQHVVPNLPVGQVTLGTGTPLAGSTTFELKLEGRPAHAASPHEGSDLAVVAAQFIQLMATMPARAWDIANRPAVISVTRVNTAEGSLNSTPASVTIEGTIRAFEPLDQAPGGGRALADIIASQVQSLARHHGVNATLSLRRGAPPTTNDAGLAAALLPLLREQPGFQVSAVHERGMFSEDFAFYTESIPALYFGIGIARDGLGVSSVHTTDFTLHPDTLDVGVAFLSALARSAGAGPWRANQQR